MFRIGDLGGEHRNMPTKFCTEGLCLRDIQPGPGTYEACELWNYR